MLSVRVFWVIFDGKFEGILVFLSKVFLVRKIIGPDAGTLYAMKVLKKATLKGNFSTTNDIMML